MNKEEIKSTSSQINMSGKGNTEAAILERDRSAPVSVSHESKEQPSSTFNANKTNDPGETLHDALARDKPGPVSVCPAGKDKPSYTYNADKTDPIDPHLADQSGYSRSKGIQK